MGRQHAGVGKETSVSMHISVAMEAGGPRATPGGRLSFLTPPRWALQRGPGWLVPTGPHYSPPRSGQERRSQHPRRDAQGVLEGWDEGQVSVSHGEPGDAGGHAEMLQAGRGWGGAEDRSFLENQEARVGSGGTSGGSGYGRENLEK